MSKAIFTATSPLLFYYPSINQPQMKVIKEHGPPTFELEHSSPHNSGPLSQPSFGSLGSGKCLLNPSGSDSQGAAAGDSPRSGSLSSCTTGGAAAAAAAAVAAGAADGSDDAAAAADDVSGGGGAAGGGGAGSGDPLRCGDAGVCTADMQSRSIRCIRQMTADEIIMHWRQFLQDVSEELLTSDDKQEQQRLANGEIGLWGAQGNNGCYDAANGTATGPARGAGSSVQQGNSSSFAKQQQQLAQQDAAEAESDDTAVFTMSSECRWCGCTNVDGLVTACCSTAAEQQQQQQPAVKREASDSGAAAAGARADSGTNSGGSGTDERLVQLVNKYSYMTKFVALLNPGRAGSGSE